MDYLTVTELAELKKCSISYISRLIKTNKISAEFTLNPETNKMHSLIPISALPEDLQAKYYRQKRTETGILPEKIETESTPQTAFKYRLKGVKKSFEEFSVTERAVIKFWTNLLREWQAERSRRKDKTEFDKIFVAHQKYMHPDIEISTDIMY